MENDLNIIKIEKRNCYEITTEIEKDNTWNEPYSYRFLRIIINNKINWYYIKYNNQFGNVSNEYFDIIEKQFQATNNVIHEQLELYENDNSRK